MTEDNDDAKTAPGGLTPLGEATIRMAGVAAALLANQGFREILRTLKNDTIVGWANSASPDATVREDHYRDVQAIGRLEARLRALIDAAKDLKPPQRPGAQRKRRPSLPNMPEAGDD